MTKPSTIAKQLHDKRDDTFATVYAATKSPRKAMLAAEPHLADRPMTASVKAQRQLKKPDIQAKIQKELEKYSKQALKNIPELLKSDNLDIKYKTTFKTIEHIRGKPLARHIGLTATASVEDVLAQLQ